MRNNYLTQIENTSELSVVAKANIAAWLVHDKYSYYRAELCELIDDAQWQVLEDSFFRVIPFGTGGRRGTVGVGSNRINRITLGEAVQALCSYLTDTLPKADKYIVIAYDSRLTSVEFSQYAASICAANGFTAYLYDDVRSTPQLSFTVRQLQATAGIVISASHNPSSDNGIKIYWEDGGQLVPPYDAELLAYGEAIEHIATIDYQTALNEQKIVLIGAPEDAAYYQAVLERAIEASNRSAKVAYSPLHGAGMSNVKPVLEKAGFEIAVLPSQSAYDGNFTNVANNIPNPEVPAASEAVIAFGHTQQSDIAITTDPDADRLGVVVLHANQQHTFLNGNQIASLLCDYILGSLQKRNRLTGKEFIAKTIVTTDMLSAIADEYGVTCRGNLLVGFKYIGELIRLHDDLGSENFVFGGEESFGALVGSYARDKDAAGSALLISELASELKDKGLTLVDRLDELQRKHGVFHEELDNIALQGAKGFTVMKHIMTTLRAETPTALGNFTVTKIRDYLPGLEIVDRSENVLRFEFSESGRDRITIRPSGTEPKLKIYTQVWVEPGDDLSEIKLQAAEKAANLRAAVNNYINSLIS